MLFVTSVIGAAIVFQVWRIRRKTHPDAPFLALLRAVMAVLVALALAQALTIVPAGHVGVVDLFGRVSATALKPGIRLVNPLARVVRLSVKTQEMKEVMDAPSQEGLTMQVEISVLFHLDPDKAPDVYKTVGEAYVPVLLQPCSAPSAAV